MIQVIIIKIIDIVIWVILIILLVLLIIVILLTLLILIILIILTILITLIILPILVIILLSNTSNTTTTATAITTTTTTTTTNINTIRIHRILGSASNPLTPCRWMQVSHCLRPPWRCEAQSLGTQQIPMVSFPSQDGFMVCYCSRWDAIIINHTIYHQTFYAMENPLSNAQKLATRVPHVHRWCPPNYWRCPMIGCWCFLPNWMQVLSAHIWTKPR